MKIWQILTATTVVALGLIVVGEPILAFGVFIVGVIALL